LLSAGGEYPGADGWFANTWAPVWLWQRTVTKTSPLCSVKWSILARSIELEYGEICTWPRLVVPEFSATRGSLTS